MGLGPTTISNTNCLTFMTELSNVDCCVVRIFRTVITSILLAYILKVFDKASITFSLVSILVNAMVIAAPLLDFSVWKTSKTISDIPTELFKYAPIKYVV